MEDCQRLERRRHDEFRRADDPDELLRIVASDARQHSIKILEREAEASSYGCTASTRRAEVPVCVQTAPDDGEVMALDVTDDAAADNHYERAPGPSSASRNVARHLGRPS